MTATEISMQHEHRHWTSSFQATSKDFFTFLQAAMMLKVLNKGRAGNDLFIIRTSPHKKMSQMGE